MYGNYNFSKKISKRVLIGVNKASSDEIEPYLHAVVSILHVNDWFVQHRFEWILGIP